MLNRSLHTLGKKSDDNADEPLTFGKMLQVSGFLPAEKSGVRDQRRKNPKSQKIF